MVLGGKKRLDSLNICVGHHGSCVALVLIRVFTEILLYICPGYHVFWLIIFIILISTYNMFSQELTVNSKGQTSKATGGMQWLSGSVLSMIFRGWIVPDWKHCVSPLSKTLYPLHPRKCPNMTEQLLTDVTHQQQMQQKTNFVDTFFIVLGKMDFKKTELWSHI